MINDNFYKKSYLLEVFDKRQAKITDAFCFSLPPENEELTYTQRITQTKTYGGLCVDRYGKEAVKISLSGSTVNQELKYIYRSSLPSQNLTGEQEIYFLRDMLEKVAEDENAELRLYDLSKSKLKVSIQSNTPDSYISNWWVVYLDSFRIKRAKDRPMTYQYTIEFTGINKKGNKSFVFEKIKIKNLDGTVDTVGKVKNSPSAIIAAIDSGISQMKIGLNAMQKVFDKGDSMTNQLKDCTRKLQEFEQVFIDYADTLQNFHTLKKKAVKEVVKVGTTTIKTFTSLGLDFTRGVMAACQLLVDANTVLKDLYEEMVNTPSSAYISEVKANELMTTVEELENSTYAAFNETIEGGNSIAANMSRAVIPTVIINTDVNGNDYPVVSYGEKPVILKDGDSLENLSYKYYGTTEYVPMLEAYNSISDDDLVIGNEIKIPVLEPEDKNFLNNIFENGNSMGTDIKLDETGDLSSFGGDFNIINGAENLNQAISVRLSAYIGSNVRNVLYGLRNSTGENSASNSYLLASIEQTLSEDPRIKSIDRISYKGRGDYLDITIVYTDINNNNYVYQGAL